MTESEMTEKAKASPNEVHIADLQLGDKLEDLLCRCTAKHQASRNPGKGGVPEKERKRYFQLEISDPTATIKAITRPEDFEHHQTLFAEGDVLRVSGYVGRVSESGQPVPILNSVARATDAEAEILQLKSFRDPEQVLAEFEHYMREAAGIATYDKVLAILFAEEGDFFKDWLCAPCGLKCHHSKVGGLRDHTVEALRIAEKLCEMFPRLHRQRLFVAVILANFALAEAFDRVTGNPTGEGILRAHAGRSAQIVRGAALSAGVSPKDVDLLWLESCIADHEGARLEIGFTSREAQALYLIEALVGGTKSVFEHGRFAKPRKERKIVRMSPERRERLLSEVPEFADERGEVLLRLVRQLHDASCFRLLVLALKNSEIRSCLETWPATLDEHYCEKGGLLDCMIATGTLVSEICQMHQRFDANLLLTAAILHPLGAIRAFKVGPHGFERTQEGTLRALSAISAGLPRELILQKPIGPVGDSGIPDDLLLQMENCIADQNGAQEGQFKLHENIPLLHAIRVISNVEPASRVGDEEQEEAEQEAQEEAEQEGQAEGEEAEQEEAIPDWGVSPRPASSA
jgi:3'-5' exoribonuclease